MLTANIQIIEGKKPIIISAPHVFSHKRPTLNGVYKKGEMYTDEIVKNVCERTGIWGIHTTSVCDFDPNYHKEKNNEYKKELRNIVVGNEIKEFVDIHGLKDGNSYDIGIYYPTRFLRSINLANKVCELIKRGKLKDLNISILRFLDNEQETLGEYAATKLRIPSIQLEIARYIREDDILRNALIENLSDIFSKEIV